MTELVIAGPSSETFRRIPPASTRQGMFSEEYVRLASYNMMNPLEGCHPVLLARAGLYYTGPDDAVQCYSCSTVLTDWRSRAIDPVQLHRQSAPECAHINGEDSTNAAIVAPDTAATERIKDLLRQRCAELDRNPTQVYYDICHSFSEIGGISRGEMFGSGPGLEPSGHPVLGKTFVYRHQSAQNIILPNEVQWSALFFLSQYNYQVPVIQNQLTVSVHHSTFGSSFKIKYSLKTFLLLKTFSPVPLP